MVYNLLLLLQLDTFTLHKYFKHEKIQSLPRVVVTLQLNKGVY